MNNLFEKMIKITYYRNRIIATIGLLIGIFFPPVGIFLLGFSLYSNVKARNNQAMKPDAHELPFIITGISLLSIIWITSTIQVIIKLFSQTPEISQTIAMLL